jgi:nucleoside-diphosphate-sugar epimerase
MSKPRLAILGASGFVGSALVERLYFDDAWRDRFDFTAFIRGSGNAARLARLPVRIESIDLIDLQATRLALSGYDHVVNCTRGDTLLMIRGLKNLTRAAQRNGVRKFIHLGSVTIYGEDPPAASAREDAPLDAHRSDYGDMKAAQDEMVFALHGRGVPSIVLCPGNIGGPYSTLIVDVVAKLLARQIVLVDAGANATNIVHIDNLVQAILAALVSDAGWGERYFVNEVEPVTWKRFFEDFAAMLGIDSRLEEVPREEVLRAMNRPAGRRSGLKGQVGALVSREFRDGVGVVPAFRAVNAFVEGLYRRLSPQTQERIRQRLSRPTRIEEARVGVPLDHKLITGQVRRVFHSPEKMMQRLGYRPFLDYRQGLETTRAWLEFAGLVPRSHPGVDPDVK